MATCLIALGANLGDRQQTLRMAVDRLTQHAALEVVSVSAWHATQPIGGPTGQAEFLNGAALIKTSLAPLSLLKALQTIENSLGRTRDQHWAARTIDLDLLLFDDQVIDQPDLQVPHPRMSFRRFVLAPAVEVAADMGHPVIGRTLSQLLAHLDRSAAYIALCGPPAVGKTQLALALQEKLGTRLLCDHENLRPENISAIDGSGPQLTPEIELLERRTAQLDKTIIEGNLATTGLPMVSDYGLHQSLAYAKLRFPAKQFQKFLLRWEQFLQQVAAPRLVIALDAPSEVLLRRIKKHDETSLESLEVLRATIKDSILSQNQGPLLQLDATRPGLVLTETLAAIEAMDV